MNKKIALFLVANNHAGKTKIAERVINHFPELKHYSIRKIITTAFSTTYRTSTPLNKRNHIQNFSEMQKAEYGPEIFIKEAVQTFTTSTHDLCIIESLRAPGEAQWILGEEFCTEFPDIIPLIIGITAPVEDRFSRFLSERPDTIATTLTREEFEKHELLSNHGDKPWEENITMTMEYTNLCINNADGNIDSAVREINDLLSLFLHTA